MCPMCTQYAVLRSIIFSKLFHSYYNISVLHYINEKSKSFFPRTIEMPLNILKKIFFFGLGGQ